MGCLGASSRSVTLLAAVLSIVASVHFMVYDALLMTAIKHPYALDSYAVKRNGEQCEFTNMFPKFEECFPPPEVSETEKSSSIPVTKLLESSNPSVNLRNIVNCLRNVTDEESKITVFLSCLQTCFNFTGDIVPLSTSDGNCQRKWEECRESSTDRKGIIDSFQCLKSSNDIIVPLCAIRFILSLCWIGSAVVLLYGNKEGKKKLVLQWIPFSIINLLYHIGIVCYGISRLVSFLPKTYKVAFDRKAEVITFIAFHDWGIIWWIIAAILIFNVYRRAYKDEDELSLSDGSSSFKSFEAVRPGEAPGELEPIETLPKMKFLVDRVLDHESAPPRGDHSEILRDSREEKIPRKHPEREPNERPEAWGDSGRPNDPRQQNPRGKNGFPAFSGADRGERMRRNPSGEERERHPRRHGQEYSEPRGEGRTRRGLDEEGKEFQKPHHPRPLQDPSDGRADRPRRRGPEEGLEVPFESEARRNRKEPRHGHRSAYDDYMSRPNDETQSNYEPRRRPDYEPKQLDTASLFSSIPRAITPSDRDYRRRKEIPLSNWQTPSKERESGTERSERREHPRGAGSREKNWTSYNGAYRNPVYEEDEPDYDPVPTQHSRHHPDEKASRF